MTTTTHTVDQALERFALIDGAGNPDDNTACVMTALSWVAGEAWSDHPDCAHPFLANMAIRANDHPATTEMERRAIVKAGATGLIDTWWIPTTVLVAFAGRIPAETGPVGRILAVCWLVSRWKGAEAKPRPVLSGAVLSGAVLSGADLRGAVLRGAVLRGAVLRGADLRGAVLSGADLSGAVLSDAVLRGAVLSGADLSGAVLSGADLRGAVLSDADLRGADLSDAVGNQFTRLPAGLTVNPSGLIAKKGTEA